MMTSSIVRFLAFWRGQKIMSPPYKLFSKWGHEPWAFQECWPWEDILPQSGSTFWLVFRQIVLVLFSLTLLLTSRSLVTENAEEGPCTWCWPLQDWEGNDGCSDSWAPPLTRCTVRMATVLAFLSVRPAVPDATKESPVPTEAKALPHLMHLLFVLSWNFRLDPAETILWCLGSESWSP